MSGKALKVRMRQCISADPEPFLPGLEYSVDLIQGVRWVLRGLADAVDDKAYKAALAIYEKAEAEREKTEAEELRLAHAAKLRKEADELTARVAQLNQQAKALEG